MSKKIKLISKPEVCEKIGKSFPIIWLWMRQGKFPLPREVAGGQPSWIESEVDEWITSKPKRQYKDADAA